MTIQDPREYSVDARKKHIVQEYVAAPMLLDGFKFDLRVYVVVTSLDPLTVHMSKVVNGFIWFVNKKLSNTLR